MAKERGPHVVYQFELRDSVIRAAMTTYRGRLYVDLREWWEPSPGNGLRPTKRGLTFPVQCIDDLETAVAALKRTLDGIETHSSSWDDDPEEAA